MSLSGPGLSTVASAQPAVGHVPLWLVVVLAAVGLVIVLTAVVEVLVGLVGRARAERADGR